MRLEEESLVLTCHIGQVRLEEESLVLTCHLGQVRQEEESLVLTCHIGQVRLEEESLVLTCHLGQVRQEEEVLVLEVEPLLLTQTHDVLLHVADVVDDSLQLHNLKLTCPETLKPTMYKGHRLHAVYRDEEFCVHTANTSVVQCINICERSRLPHDMTGFTAHHSVTQLHVLVSI